MQTRTLLLAGIALFLASAVTSALALQTPPAVNVMSYGAKGDGATDDAAAIQAAIDACPAGGVVSIPKGVYLIREQIKLHSGLTLQGVGTGSVILKGKDLAIGVRTAEASKISLANIRFAVEATSPAVEKGELVHFRHCADVQVSHCDFDGTAMDKLPSQIQLLGFECCNDVKCLNNQFLNTAGAATGVTGASGDDMWGHRSEFAHNTVNEYCDTGIGIWTGASDANIHDNKLHGRAEKFTSFPVGVDVDGGTHSVIENNDISGGQIAIRLYDVHNGVYPIEGILIKGNTLHDQLTYDNVHPAWAIKPDNPKSKIEATIENNTIVESAPNALGIMGGGEGHTVLHVDGNDCTGATFWSFGFYKEGAIEVYSNGQKVDWKAGPANNTVH